MAATSISAAKDDLLALLAEDTVTGTPKATLATVQRIYRGEPRAGDLIRGVGVTIATAGMSADDYQFTVRVYAKPDVDVLATQNDLDRAIDEVDTALNTTSEFSRTDWQVAYLADIDCFVASTITEAGRQDYG